MKNFLLGLTLGAAAVYVTTKLVDEKTRKELFDEVDKATDTTKEKLRSGRGQALRMGVLARKELRKGKQKLSQAAGDLAGKLSEELAEFEAKSKAKA
ncbi:MAG: hypothetical protein RL662_177 [Bacteroidota bacterium]